MAFSKVAIAIPEVTGDIEITVVTEESVLAYTNQIPISTDTDGSIYNSVGYRESYRIRSTGMPASSTETVGPHFVTGFIPVKPGDIIRFYNAYVEGESGALNTCAYDSNKEYTNRYIFTPFALANHSSSTFQTLFAEYNYNTEEQRLYSFKLKGDFQEAYLRFTLIGEAKDAIITINEEVLI